MKCLKFLKSYSTQLYDIINLQFHNFCNSQPEENYMGLQDLIKQSIERVDAENRRELLSNIMIVGGNSMIPNMVERL